MVYEKIKNNRKLYIGIYLIATSMLMIPMLLMRTSSLTMNRVSVLVAMCVIFGLGYHYLDKWYSEVKK